MGSRVPPRIIKITLTSNLYAQCKIPNTSARALGLKADQSHYSGIKTTLTSRASKKVSYIQRR